jgi:hypothetical protein
MNDRDFDELVETMKQHHNPPPPVPRDRMWARIEAGRQARARRRPAWRTWAIPLAAAAVLTVGFAIGRWTLRPDAGPLVADVEPPTPPPAAAGPRDETSALVRHAAADLFNRADALLTDLKISSCATNDAEPVAAWAGNLMVQTRLLLDSPLGDDPETKALLQDLELVLARISRLSAQDCAGDVDRIRQDIDSNATLDRLRMAAAGRESRFI